MSIYCFVVSLVFRFLRLRFCPELKDINQAVFNPLNKGELDSRAVKCPSWEPDCCAPAWFTKGLVVTLLLAAGVSWGPGIGLFGEDTGGECLGQSQEATEGTDLWQLYSAYHQNGWIGTTTASFKTVKMTWETITAACNWKSSALFWGGVRWDENLVVLQSHTVGPCFHLASLSFYLQIFTQAEDFRQCIDPFVHVYIVDSHHAA